MITRNNNNNNINKNVVEIVDNKKMGFAVVFSSIISNSKNLYKANALTSFINADVSNKTFHSQYHSEYSNKLYNRMKFLGEYHINIININREHVFNMEDRHIIFPVRYKRGNNYHLDSYNYNDNDKDKDKDNPMLKVIVYNLNFEEFFNFDSLWYMMTELKNTIFFFETDKWSEIINNFYMNGVFISGGSSNQRHIFNSLDYTFSMLMLTLFGKNFTQEATNYMKYKKVKKDLFNSDFRYNSIFNIIFRNFESITFINEKIISFRNISRIIFSYDPILDYITPWDILRFWMQVINNMKGNKYFLINILNDILIMLDKDKNEEEIISFLKENHGFKKDINKDFKIDDLKIIRDVDSRSMDEFFYKRFINKSNVYYPDKLQRINDNRFSFFNKREYHTSTSRCKQITKNKPLNISDIKLNKFLIKIEGIVNDNILDSRSKQLNLENFFLDFYQNLKDEQELGKKQKIDIKTKYLLQYNERLNVLSTNNSLFRKFGNFSYLLNNINWIFLTSSILSISNKKGYNSTAINIGENIIFNIFLYYKKNIINKIYKKSIILNNKKFISKNNKAYEILDFFNKENIEKWQNMSLLLWKKELEIDFKFILTLGDLFISLFTDELANENPIFLRRANENNDPYIIIFNPEIDKNLINEFLDIPSNTLPMIHKPDEWNKDKTGGFLSDYFKNESLITNPKPSSNSHETKNLEKAYEVVNQLNSIEFEINNLLLNYLINEGDWFLELIKSKSDKDEWVYSELTIQIAKAYSKIDKFYFNHYLDWRGRIYNSSHYLNYQGSDLGRSLLLFKKGEKLNDTGKYYFYIAIANSHNENNLSKSSLSDRYNWVIFNYYKIINLDKELISNAEKPFNFLALALSLREYDNDNDFFIKNPIFLDATCSGIQHVSALIRDFELATLTNLNNSTHKDIPEDFYTDVINKVNNEIQDYGKKNIEYSNLKNVELNRKIAKQSIMTVVYNVSIHGMKKQLESKTKKEIRSNVIIDNLFDKRTKKVYNELEKLTKTRKLYLFEFPSKNKNETVLLNYKEVFMISKKLNEFIFNEYKGLGKVYFFISEIAKITNLLNLPIIWKTPNGLEFQQYYHNYKKTHAKITLYGEVKELHYLTYFNELDKRKQRNAIIPNVIHTLDATHVYKIIEEGIINDINVLTIHDCFGTHPNNMGKIHHIVRKTFILQYTNYDFLNNFRNKIIGMIKLNDYKVMDENNITKLIYNNKEYIIPQTPELGDFDLKQIEGSNYIIC